MAKYGPASAFLLVGGVNLTSSDAFGLDESVEELLNTEAHGIGDSWQKSLPIGVARVALAVEKGIYDDREAGPIDALQEMGATLQEIGYGFAGDGVSASVVMIDGTYVMKWSRSPARDNLIMAGGEFTITGDYYRGLVVSGLDSQSGDGDTESSPIDQADYATAVSIATSETNDDIVCSTAHGLTAGDHVLIAGHSGSTPDINGDQIVNTVVNTTTFQIGVDITVAGTGGTVKKTSTDSWIADLHVPALDLGGGTNVVVTLRDSADGTTFSDVTSGAFTAVTAAPASERKSATGQIRRYRAIDWAFTGGSSQSVTPVVFLYSV